MSNDGGPAFPMAASDNGGGSKFGIFNPAQEGMSLRDYFAGQALMSMLSEVSQISDTTYEVAARLSYKFADAMIAERSK